MTDRPPAPEPDASLARDGRGVSTTLGYTLTLSITAVLIAGLLTAGGAVIEDQRQSVTTEQLSLTGQELAAGFEEVDRLGADATNGSVRARVELPQRVAGSTYTIRVENHSGRTDQPARATIVASADSVDTRVNTSFRTAVPVRNQTFPGGPVVLTYDSDDQQLDVVDDSDRENPLVPPKNE